MTVTSIYHELPKIYILVETVSLTQISPFSRIIQVC